MSNNDQVTIKNARIIFRNFAGKASRFNAAGARNFCVIIPEDKVEEMVNDGWNIKRLRPRDEDELPPAYIQVSLSFSNYPPKVWLIAGKSKTMLDDETIASLDYAEIENVDLIIRPYTWEVRGETGKKAYLKKMYVTVVQDDLDLKYKDFGIEDDNDDVPWED